MGFDLHHFFGDGHLVPSPAGGFDHYDGSGHHLGHDAVRLDGGVDQYDAMGAKLGHLQPDLGGHGFAEYDRMGHLVGHVQQGVDGGLTHRDANGHLTHRTTERLDGGHEVYAANGMHAGSITPDHLGGLTLHGDPLMPGHHFAFPPFGG